MGGSLDIPERRLAVPDPANFPFAVFCCSFKMDLSSPPEHSVVLFADRAMAERYGAWMWPATFEVIDRFSEGDEQ